MNILCFCEHAALLVSGGVFRVCGWVCGWVCGFCCFADFVELLSVRYAHVELMVGARSGFVVGFGVPATS